MSDLPGHYIPNNVRMLEFGDDDEERNKILSEFKKNFDELKLEIFDGSETLTRKYTEKFTTLLYMEEAASSKEFDQFDLHGVKITVDNEHHTIQVVSVL